MAYRKIPKPAPKIRILGEHQLIPNRYEWVEPAHRGQTIPVIRTEDGPYIPVKF